MRTVGKLKVVELKYKAGFKAVQPARYPVPYHYQERLATQLRKVEAEGVVEKVNPAEPADCEGASRPSSGTGLNIEDSWVFFKTAH